MGLKKRRKKNYEDVDQTIEDIRAEKNKKKQGIKRILVWLFLPFTFPVVLLKHIFSIKRIPLNIKTTVIFTAIFGVLTIVYVLFVMLSFSVYLRETEGTNEFLRAMWIGSAFIIILFLFAGYMAGSVISKAMLKPIRDMSENIDQISEENLSQRLDEAYGRDELGELARQINNMLFILEQAFERQSDFVADASHELKTPIAVINGYSNLLLRWGKEDKAILDEGLQAISRESAIISKIIDQLLVLAKIGRLGITKTIFDPPTVIQEMIQGYRVLYEGRQIKLECMGYIEIETDKNLFIEAVRILVDNALKYSLDDVEIFVIQTPVKTQVMVKDYGRGISEEDLPHIFDRFYRCDKTRGRDKGSSGLGLTICKSIMETIGGEVVISSKEEEGTEAVIIIGSELYA